MDAPRSGLLAQDRSPGPLRDIERPLAVFGRLYLTAAVFLMLAYAGAIVLVLTSGETDGDARQVEFVALWSAARLALEGNAIGAFDQELLRQVQSLPSDAGPGELYWLYPPGLQFLLAPLGLLPYWAAWVLFGLASLGAFAAAYWRPAASVPLGQGLLIGAPAVMIALQIGHVVLLWAAALGAALRAMAHGREGLSAPLAGLLIALLSLKPQLGLLLPVALVAARRWDVVLWALAGAVALHGLPTLFVGVDYWAIFFRRMAQVADAVGRDMMPHHLMLSPYAFARYAGLAHAPALALQAGVLAGVAGAVWRVWRRRGGDGDLAAGALLTAIPLATPYAYFYELGLLVPAAIFLVRGGCGAGWADRALLALALFGPLALFVHTPLAPLFAPLLLVLFARATMLALRRSDAG